ncbi:hypothetical protein OIO90_001381 [Microbotryomycetes sp. JL221]|nr:hypothetical protein OIO90_001381 [Microbotryomycetes sp. JL221]
MDPLAVAYEVAGTVATPVASSLVAGPGVGEVEAPAETRFIGLALAIASSAMIGTSFIITKKGLISAADRHEGMASSSNYSYLRNGLWWTGMVTMVVGEVCNFAAYLFAPPVLVTPLGALSVLVGAVLASIFLGEKLGRIGISGCSLCLVGSLIIVLHSPEDKQIGTVDEVLEYAFQPGFMLYGTFVLVFSLWMIYKVAPVQGNSNPLVYISICSLVGSISVMAIKGLGVALKLTFEGNNQLWRPGTWVFAFTVAFCIAVQMNYFNKALDLFPTTIVNPSYFVGFSTCTLIASVILFHGLNTEGGSNTASLLCGLFVISMGVYLLNLSRSENESSGPNKHSLLDSGIMGQRTSMSNRLSIASDGGGGVSDATVRRSTTLYRGGGALAGGVEPIFDYHETSPSHHHHHHHLHSNGRIEHHVQMERFTDEDDNRTRKTRSRNYDDDDDDDDVDLNDEEANRRWRSGEGSRGSLLKPTAES